MLRDRSSLIPFFCSLTLDRWREVVQLLNSFDSRFNGWRLHIFDSSAASLKGFLDRMERCALSGAKDDWPDEFDVVSCGAAGCR